MYCRRGVAFQGGIQDGIIDFAKNDGVVAAEENVVDAEIIFCNGNTSRSFVGAMGPLFVRRDINTALKMAIKAIDHISLNDSHQTGTCAIPLKEKGEKEGIYRSLLICGSFGRTSTHLLYRLSMSIRNETSVNDYVFGEGNWGMVIL